MSENPQTIDAPERNQGINFYFAYAGLFWTLVGLVTAGLILLHRAHLYTPPMLMIASASIFISAAFAPFLIPAQWQAQLGDRYFIYPLVSFAVLASPLLVRGLGHYLVYVYPVLALAGIARAMPQLRTIERRAIIFLLVSAPLVAVYLFLSFNVWDYANVFAPELALLGKIRKDTYYATVISHMIQNFGVSSTGLDGLVRLRYHTGSHTWFASLGKLTGQVPLFSYPLGLMMTGIPAQLLALSFAIICAAKNKWRVESYFAWMLAIVLVTDALGRPSHYVSESYQFGITALLFAMPLLMDLVAHPKRSAVDDWARLALCAVLVFALNSLKISVGILWTCALSYSLLRLYPLRSKILAILPVLVAVQALAFYLYNDPGQAAVVAPLKFFSSHPRLLFLTCEIVPCLLLAAALVKLRIRVFAGFKETFRSKAMVDVEAVFVFALVGALPAFLFRVSNAWAWFFFNVAQWAATPVLFSYLSFAKWPRLNYKIAVYASVLMLVAAIADSPESFRYLKRNRDFISNLHQNSLRGVGDKWALYGANLGDLLHDYPGYKAYSIIMNAAAGRTKGFAVFVPPENTAFWRIVKNCVAQPMFVPAVTGRPMLFGLPPKDLPCELKFYGYPDYGPDEHSHEIDNKSLCAHARDKKIELVLLLRDLDNLGRNEILNCAELLK